MYGYMYIMLNITGNDTYRPSVSVVLYILHIPIYIHVLIAKRGCCVIGAEEVESIIEEFDQAPSHNPNFMLWSTYISMVDILLYFIRAKGCQLDYTPRSIHCDTALAHNI